jgi:hypothetical protein
MPHHTHTYDLAEEIDFAQLRLKEFFGVLATKEQVQGWIESEPELKRDIMSMGMDTSNTEWLIDVIAKSLGITTAWPVGGSTQSYTAAFFTIFAERAIKAGIKLSENFIASKL